MVEPKIVRDVVVVGGGAAGLSSAVTLARARLRVSVVDAGEPRNAPADGVHALLGLEGIRPAELLARGRAEVIGYGGEVVDGEVVEAQHAPDGFTLILRDATTLRAPRLVIATGLIDELPDIPGVREQWGHGVLHCPFCHGWEVRDRRIGVLATGPMAVHQAVLFHQWSPQVILFAGGQELTAADRTRVQAVGITIVDGTIARLESSDDLVRGVRLSDGRLVEVDAAVVGSRMRARAEPFTGIGIETTEHPMGRFIAADEFGRTSVPGVWAAGNVGNLSAQVITAAAEGTRAGQAIVAEVVTTGADRAVAGVAEAVQR